MDAIRSSALARDRRHLACMALVATTAMAILAGCSGSATPTMPTNVGRVTLNVVAGSAQRAPVNTTLPQAVRVQVLDNTGRPVPNFLLNFVVTSGGGHVFGGTEQTNSSGYADEQWTLGPRLGPQTLEAREVNSWTGVPASYGKFTATATPPNNVLVVTTSGPTGLAVMNADGSGLRTINVGNLKVAQPALSPDHTRILFVDPTGGLNGDIYQVNANGSGLTFVTGGFGPTWSPDNVGQLFEFSNQYGGTIYGSTQIESGPSYCIDTDGWSFSADGKKLLGILGGSPDCTDSTLVFAGQSGLYVLTIGQNERVPLLANAKDPEWSPDGQHIAATSNGQTVVMDPDGNNLKVALSKSHGPVSWSPDSQIWAVDSGYVNADGTNYMVVKGCPCKFAWR